MLELIFKNLYFFYLLVGCTTYTAVWEDDILTLIGKDWYSDNREILIDNYKKMVKANVSSATIVFTGEGQNYHKKINEDSLVITFNLDINGNITEVTRKSYVDSIVIKDELSNQRNYKYDDKGFLIEESFDYGIGKKCKNKYLNKYSSNSIKISNDDFWIGNPEYSWGRSSNIDTLKFDDYIELKLDREKRVRELNYFYFKEYSEYKPTRYTWDFFYANNKLSCATGYLDRYNDLKDTIIFNFTNDKVKRISNSEILQTNTKSRDAKNIVEYTYMDNGKIQNVYWIGKKDTAFIENYSYDNESTVIKRYISKPEYRLDKNFNSILISKWILEDKRFITYSGSGLLSKIECKKQENFGVMVFRYSFKR